MATLNLQTKKAMSESNYRRLVSILVGLMASQSTIESQCLFPYDETKTYSKNMICLYQNHLYLCKSATTGVFNANAWEMQNDSFTQLEKSDIEALLNLSQQDLDNLQNLIDDAQITLTKTHSSSKIYADIQQCLDDSKAYTLKELSKISGASYKVVASISEMTSESIIYLLPNATNYDMYIVEADGTAQKIGNMDIDLSQYYTKDEIDNDFLKKTDADGKFATITTVDKKIDKTVVSKMVQHIDKYIVIDSPRNDSNELNRLYAGNDFVSFQKFTGNTIDKDFRLFDMVSGLTPLALSTSDDLNDLNYNTFFSANNTCANIPYTANFMGISVVYTGVPNYGFQLVCDANENQGGTNTRTLFIRHNYNGTWGDWDKILTAKSRPSTPVPLGSYVNTTYITCDVENNINVVKCGNMCQLNISGALFSQELEGASNLIIMDNIPEEYRPVILTEITLYSTGSFNSCIRGFITSDGKLMIYSYYDANNTNANKKISGYLFGTTTYFTQV